ncbi:hypothetical protein OG985_42185 [Streptomyces sp. NBC_00289]
MRVLDTGDGVDTADTVRISVAPWGLESFEGLVEFDVTAEPSTPG